MLTSLLLFHQIAAMCTQPFDVVKTHRQMELGEIKSSKLFKNVFCPGYSLLNTLCAWHGESFLFFCTFRLVKNISYHLGVHIFICIVHSWKILLGNKCGVCDTCKQFDNVDVFFFFLGEAFKKLPFTFSILRTLYKTEGSASLYTGR